MLHDTLGLTGGYWPARWFLMGHRFEELGREPLRCLAMQPLLCKYHDSYSNAAHQSPPGELFMLRLSLLVCFMELKKHQVLRHVADASGTSACWMDF